MRPHIPFNLLIAASGMTRDEACALLNVSRNTLDGWMKGRRGTPYGVNTEMSALVLKQDKTANAVISQIQAAREEYPALAEVEIGYPADNHEAEGRGFPCVNAWLAMAGRVVAWCESQEPRITVKLVPRGATPATAAAIDAQGG